MTRVTEADTSGLAAVIRERSSEILAAWIVQFERSLLRFRRATKAATHTAQVANLPALTPSLDLVRAVPIGGNAYDFVVPPPVPADAATVAEGAKKPTTTWVATKVSGTIETQAVIIDVTKQTLEDDASAAAAS